MGIAPQEEVEGYKRIRNKPRLISLQMNIKLITALTLIAAGTAGCLNRSASAVKNLSAAQARHKQARLQTLDHMQQAMGPLPSWANLPPIEITFIDSIRRSSYSRFTISFEVAQRERIYAYLYLPSITDHAGKFPAMLALHETDMLGKGSVDGQGSNSNLAYARELAERGYIVIAPDYPGFGSLKDYDFDADRYQSGTMKGIFDHMRCVDLLQSLPNVDTTRIGVIGHSLGGHNAIFVAAFDPRLKITVSSCGWTLFEAYNIGEKEAVEKGGALWPWAQKRYMPLLSDVYHLDAKLIPFDFDEVITSIAPRAFFCNAPINDANFSVAGVRKGIEAVGKAYRELQASKNLRVVYPSARHDFPSGARLEAYAFIDSALQPGKAMQP